ncbi:pyridine nucleotide transhydrogenase [Shewanella sp. WXL01]|uniref:pyridine nucleotide transhydrogenase n=1 Tax=Shewanella sp. WXL01 TaxID=2709721 RepID=UPI0014383E91|nr:pyridine nucleotide transhydrogenase [Shewanella sp. WXL01]NKF52670.1 pyridine nucleotide transhydrogenase [Shewanella sp. WXL01]
MAKKSALIGYSGFVGSTLLKQSKFDELYRSTNIENIRGNSFGTVVCAGAPAVKWLANKNPEQDRQSIQGLISHLSTIKCDQFILISTVDVFKTPLQVTESTPVDTDDLHAYGLHRHELEEFVKSHFDNYLIVRLPGLVGPGLKKNVIFDFLNDNNLDVIDSRGVFQFYPMVNLWSDIQVAINNNIDLLHLTAEPVSVGDIASECFNLDFNNELTNPPASYDFQTNHASLYGSELGYQYAKREVFLAIRSYAQSEALKEDI